MVSHEEFTGAVEAFLDELGFACSGETEDRLRRFPEFYHHFCEVVAEIETGTVARDNVLLMAFGLVEGYIESERAMLLTKAHEFFQSQRRPASE
jgi:hypothetical protein